VYERFATLDALSSGRAEVILGRGSFIESFPLFGYDLRDYEVLFEEKLDLFSQLLTEKPVTWQGTTRARSRAPTSSRRRRTAFARGSESVARRSRSCAPPATATDSCSRSSAARPIASALRRPLPPLARVVRAREAMPVGVHSPGHIADTDEQAWEELYPAMEANRNAIGAERGWPPYSRLQFQHDIGPEGAVYAGSPETVARKIAATVKTLGATRFDLKYANGTLSHAKLMRSIELYGTKVAPMVRRCSAS
jgi:alkanesulfonate monooxygenase SsuD/methylene tetrahydromethanopterin reductase-like flavin-dependent oxidoreductase (luciferase family)